MKLPVDLRAMLDRVARVGALPQDDLDTRLQKATLTLTTGITTALAFVWVGTYFALGLPAAAAIPLAYQVSSVANLVYFGRTKRYAFFRTLVLILSLLLPFFLQWTLGGFVASSAVSIWAFTCPLGALVFVSPRGALPWFLAFLVLIAASGFIDPHLTSQAAHIPHPIQIGFFVGNILGVALVTYSVMRYFVSERERAMTALDREHRLLQQEQDKSERLLLNVLPREVAGRLKETDGIIAERHPDVTVLFADIVGFTPLAGTMEAEAVVELLNELFVRFDDLALANGLEKIKTIGDAYMVAGGLPTPRQDHAMAVAEMALEMRDVVDDVAATTGNGLAVRIGIDTGPVVAGVIGRAKFSYDLWGDTVNTASRMESHGVPGSIQVTERTYQRLRDRYRLEERGTIEVKGKGEMRTYLLVGRSP